jgi:hypothetical protein
VRRLADERHRLDDRQDGRAGAVDADRDHVAGDLLLQLVGRALGDDPALIDDREPIGERVGLLEVVGREEDGRAGLAQVLDLLPHARPRLRVEAGRGLVEEEDLGPVDDAEPHVEAAPHAAGVRPGRPVGGRLEVELLEDLDRAGPGLGDRHPVEPALQDELTAAGLGRVGRAALRDVADPLPDQLRLAPEVGAGDGRITRRGGDQRRQHPQGRGLACPVRAEEAEDLARADVEVDAGDGLDRTRPGLEGPPQVARVDHRAADRSRVRHVDAPCLVPDAVRGSVLARFSNMGQYLSSADNYPIRSQCQP